MFQNVEAAPPDAILGLVEAFKKDTNPAKINLSVGVFQDATGQTPIPKVVTEAEKRLLESETNKAYKPITGDPEFGRLVQQLMFGESHEIVTSGRAATAHTPGGTGALRVAADYINKVHSGSAIWLSDPTWANHAPVFKAAGLDIKSYPYLDRQNNCLDFQAMLEAMQNVPARDVVMLHGCCHNPTGVDPNVEQWAQVAKLLAERGALPLIDFAYQGFADGIDEDAAGLRELANHCYEILVCSSFSKNFGLYNERTGAFTIVASDQPTAANVISQVKACIRANYSNPPAHGGAIVKIVLSDPDLKAAWINEVADMRNRINDMRTLLVDTLKSKGVEQDFSFITSQRGMFSFSGLTKDQVDKLKNEYAIYIVGSGRINVAGITEQNIDTLCDAIAAVL